MTIVYLLFPLFVLIGVSAAILVPRILWRCNGDSFGEAAGTPFSVLSIDQAFDPDHAIIWDTQMPALRLIHSAEPRGLSLRRLHQWYLESACHYPELYEGGSFKQWLAFCEQSRLITYEEKRVVLMPIGHELLHHWVSAQSNVAWTSEFSNSDTE